MDIILFIGFLVVSIATLGLGFGLNYQLKTCRLQRHEMFYLAVLSTLLALGYVFLVDEDTEILHQVFPEIYYGLLLQFALALLFLYLIYAWSGFAYAALVASLLVGSTVMVYELSVLQPYLSSTEYLDLQWDFLRAIAQDAFKMGLVLGAKYKFLK